MYIDAHVHAFVDELAERAVAKLCTTADILCYTDGKIGGARKLLRENGIDYGVLLPIATKPSQQRKINDWALSVSNGNLISFGTIHPYAEDVFDELERIKAMGLKGIKLHPDYQGVFLFEDCMLPIFKRCAELDLPVTIHMGYDPISPLIHRAMPQDLVEIHRLVPEVKLIGAHMGGMYAWEAVCKYVAGLSNVWLDTAYVSGFMPQELFAKLIEKHGADRVLLASDLPWQTTDMEIKMIEQLTISDNDKEKIFWKNTAELLHLSL